MDNFKIIKIPIQQNYMFVLDLIFLSVLDWENFSNVTALTNAPGPRRKLQSDHFAHFLDYSVGLGRLLLQLIFLSTVNYRVVLNLGNQKSIAMWSLIFVLFKVNIRKRNIRT